MSTQLSPEEIVKSYKDAFKEKIIDSRVERHPVGPKNTDLIQIWMTADKTVYKDMVKHLLTLDKTAHFAVSSGYDIKDTINIVHHFSIYHGRKGNEISINFTTPLPKNDLTIDTIADLIPGALISEQEKQEMLGIKVIDIPKDTRVFISDDFPEDMYPWRKDDKNVDSMIHNFHEPSPSENKTQEKPKKKPTEKGGSGK